MKKMFSSTQFLLLFAAMFSLFIVACLKEQGDNNFLNSNNSAKQFDNGKVKITIQDSPKQSSRALSVGHGCLPSEDFTNCVNAVLKGQTDLQFLGLFNQPCICDVTIKYSICTDANGFTTIYFYGTEIEFCDNLLKHWDLLNDPVLIAEQEELFFKTIQQETIQAFLASLPAFFSISIDCPTNRVNTETYNDICFKLCKGNELGTKRYNRLTCGSQCCIKTADYCRRTDGSFEISNVSYRIEGESCDGDASGCDNEFGSCQHSCGDDR